MVLRWNMFCQVHPQPESYWGNVNPIGPRACYDEGKRVAETLAYAYHKQSGVDVRVARIFNTYGPRMHANDGRVVSNFIIQVRHVWFDCQGSYHQENIHVSGNREQSNHYLRIRRTDSIIPVRVRPGVGAGVADEQWVSEPSQHRQPPGEVHQHIRHTHQRYRYWPITAQYSDQ